MIAIQVAPATRDALDRLVAAGRFRSHDDVIAAGLRLMGESVSASADDEADAAYLYDLNDVFDEWARSGPTPR